MNQETFKIAQGDSTMMEQPDTFWTLLHNWAHWEFEIFLMILFDGIIFGIIWNSIRKHWQHHLDRDRQEASNGSSIPGLLNRVKVHINANGSQYITPRDVGLGVGINDGEAFVLLNLLAKAKILKRAYNVYCISTDTIMDSVEYTETLDEISRFCPTCNSEHEPSQLRVEIAFEEIL